MSAPDVSIQWQGTEVCGDFHCECGAHAHICGVDFLFRIQCMKCGVVWDLPHSVSLTKSNDQIPAPGTYEAVDDRTKEEKNE